MVGAVVVTPAGIVAGSGFHARAGEAHAEVHALGHAGEAARGATLYCTLEPCSHDGRTPPCVDRILEAGVTRVVAAVEDPNPLVAGGGLRRLRAAGIAVEVGLRRDEAVRLNRAFFTALERRRPFVIAKAATSLDGCVAARRGASTRLTSAPADRHSQMLRAEVDAIGVGTGTLLIDDPRLTVREVYRERPLARVIFDRRLRTPPSARVFTTLAAGPVYIIATAPALAADPASAQALASVGATMVAVPDASLASALGALAALGIQCLLVEGGPTLQAAFWQARLVDAVRLIVTPRMMGAAGVPWLGRDQAAIPSLFRVEVTPCGPDVIIEGDVYWTG
jgi:diaminohydroxyphosphoribosylaminopyrimidine deaminase/5-amino-6-(5-phosphoribosylamino)uracil reductase